MSKSDEPNVIFAGFWPRNSEPRCATVQKTVTESQGHSNSPCLRFGHAQPADLVFNQCLPTGGTRSRSEHSYLGLSPNVGTKRVFPPKKNNCNELCGAKLSIPVRTLFLEVRVVGENAKMVLRGKVHTSGTPYPTLPQTPTSPPPLQPFQPPAAPQPPSPIRTSPVCHAGHGRGRPRWPPPASGLKTRRPPTKTSFSFPLFGVEVRGYLPYLALKGIGVRPPLGLDWWFGRGALLIWF